MLSNLAGYWLGLTALWAALMVQHRLWYGRWRGRDDPATLWDWLRVFGESAGHVIAGGGLLVALAGPGVPGLRVAAAALAVAYGVWWLGDHCSRVDEHVRRHGDRRSRAWGSLVVADVLYLTAALGGWRACSPIRGPVDLVWAGLALTVGLFAAHGGYNLAMEDPVAPPPADAGRAAPGD